MEKHNIPCAGTVDGRGTASLLFLSGNKGEKSPLLVPQIVQKTLMKTCQEFILEEAAPWRLVAPPGAMISRTLWISFALCQIDSLLFLYRISGDAARSFFLSQQKDDLNERPRFFEVHYTGA